MTLNAFPAKGSATITDDTTPVNTAASGNRIDIREAKGGSFYTDVSPGTLTWYGALDDDDDPKALADEDGNAYAKSYTAGQLRPLPIEEAYGCQYLFAKGSSAGGTLYYKVK